MIVPSLGRWSHRAGPLLIRERIYRHGWRWTPLARVRRRYGRGK